MKTMWLSCFILILQFSSSARAYGERGFAERALYWLAYLAETEILKVDPNYTPTIAPKCSPPGEPRCTFQQFMVHIWAPRRGTTGIVEPNGVRGRNVPRLNNLDGNLSEMIGAIMAAQFTFPGSNDKEYLDGDTKADKTVAGAQDWYRALAQVGRPINIWHEMTIKTQGLKPSKFQDKIWTMGREAGFLVAVLRRSDLDKQRFKYLEEKIREKPGVPPTFEFEWEVVDTAWNGAQGRRVIDLDKTLNKYDTTVPGIKSIIEDAYDDWIINGRQAREHANALQAAQTALGECGCTRPYPTGLKKRDMTISYDWGGPKAARSMRMKLRMLRLQSDQ